MQTYNPTCGVKRNNLCFRLLRTQNKAFLPHFALNMHVEWPKFHKLEKLNGLISSSENVKNRSTPISGSKQPENRSDSWKKKGVVGRYAFANSDCLSSKPQFSQ